ncbi:MAG: pantoate--beta-alanine ligase [Candidatus Methylomirabilis oxyfera]|nr:pantoate--beta-alanine ligase [Candidatus Methylomirabilis oxyfera]
MEIIHEPSVIQRRCESIRCGGATIGLVPTMGCLHEGHLSLMRRARVENDVLVVSIFVNPTQFGQGEDFDSYPRDLQGDLVRLEGVGADVVFAPRAESIYPKRYGTFVEVAEITEWLCGASRPGHFRGVATVVAKLFNLMKPHRAYFGQKDYQQTVVVRRLVADLNFDLTIAVLPTVREPDGLAMSSRNARLTPDERRMAAVLYRSLRHSEERIKGGERQATIILDEMRAMIEAQPLAQIDYVALCDSETLKAVDRIEGPTLAAVAVKFGATRLIDNILIPTP